MIPDGSAKTARSCGDVRLSPREDGAAPGLWQIAQRDRFKNESQFLVRYSNRLYRLGEASILVVYAAASSIGESKLVRGKHIPESQATLTSLGKRYLWSRNRLLSVPRHEPAI